MSRCKYHGDLPYKVKGCPTCASEPPVRSSDVVLREQVRAAIDAEPELPGEMPKNYADCVKVAMKHDKELYDAVKELEMAETEPPNREVSGGTGR